MSSYAIQTELCSGQLHLDPVFFCDRRCQWPGYILTFTHNTRRLVFYGYIYHFANAQPPCRQDHSCMRHESCLDFESRSIEIVSPFIEILSRSIEILSRSIEILSPFIEILSRSIEILSRSIEILSPFIEILSRSIEILSRSIEILRPFIEILSRSIEILSRSIEILSPFIEILSRSIEILSRLIYKKNFIWCPFPATVETKDLMY